MAGVSFVAIITKSFIIMFKKFIYMASLALVVSSCAKDVFEAEEIVEKEDQQVVLSEFEKDSLKAQFARVLSSVVFENEEVRELIKTEAVKQFDKNYDVLYISIRDKQIGGHTFRDLLVRESSEGFIREIERGIPLLNILFPNLPMFDLSPEQYDSKDKELPVAAPRKDCNELYYNGECTDRLEKGQIPGFHTLVVNENSRVIVHNDTRRGISTFSFKSPNYDGTKTNDFATRSTTVPTSILGGKAATAYMHFYADDSSVYSKALQRDYIYYGMTPTCHTGTLNQNINEYISFIEVDPNVYFTVTDDYDLNSYNPSDDPYIKANSVSKTHTDFTEQELIDAFWTSGAYNFRLEVQNSSGSSPQILYIPLRPEQIWNFNLTRTYQHATWFTPKKYTYTINPADFTSKRHDLFSDRIALGKWNIKNESLYRYISILEEDHDGATYTASYSYESAILHSDKFSNTGKVVLGLGDSSIQGNVVTEVSDSNSTKTIKTATVTRIESSDHLGSVRIYFYDPIAEYSELEISEMYTYNTGCVRFGVTASLP